jgi:VanZ family protein
MLRPLKYRALWFALGILAILAMVTLSLLPGTTGPTYPGFDKLEHITAYVLLTTWFGAMFERRGYALLALLLLLLGIGVELAQGWMAVGRQADWRDLVANSAGIGIGLFLSMRSRQSWLARVEQWLPAT